MSEWVSVKDKGVSKTTGGKDPAKYMRLPSAKSAILGVGRLRQAATSCSHPRQPAGAGGEAMGWTKPPHHTMLGYRAHNCWIRHYTFKERII